MIKNTCDKNSKTDIVLLEFQQAQKKIQQNSKSMYSLRSIHSLQAGIFFRTISKSLISASSLELAMTSEVKVNEA